MQQRFRSAFLSVLHSWLDRLVVHCGPVEEGALAHRSASEAKSMQNKSASLGERFILTKHALILRPWSFLNHS